MSVENSARDSFCVTVGPESPASIDAPYLVYRLVPRANGKTDKVPVSPETLYDASAHDSSTWVTFPTAEFLAESLGDEYGIGIVIRPDSGLFAIDLDGCTDGVTWAPYVESILQRFPGAYVEVSVSGTGLHIIGKYSGPRPSHGTRCPAIKGELYTGDRFIALGRRNVSGDMLSDHTAAFTAFCAEYFPPRDGASGSENEWTVEPVPGHGIADDDELIERALRSQSARAAFGGAVSFNDLWNGDADKLGRAFPPQAPGQPYDGSAADLALANHLAFWTGGNCEQIGRLLRASGLARPKHDREDYLRSTVLRACAGQQSWYAERATAVGVPPAAAAPSSAAPPALNFPPEKAGAADDNPTPSTSLAHTITFDRQGRVEATLANIAQLLRDGHAGDIRYDTFTDQIIVDAAPMTDDVITRIRIAFETLRVAPPSKDTVRDAIEIIARDNAYDSAQDWANSIPWDGVPRVETFLHAYCGAPNTEYSRSVSSYLWTALAGRVLDPGCQADMVPVLVGPQGVRKTTGVAAIAPTPEFFTDIRLSEKEADLARRMRGKVIGEIAELQGLKTRDAESIKSIITTRYDHWVPKFKEFSTTAARRLVFVGTTNEDRFLDDHSGERRWLPVRVGMIQADDIKADREQLWAEAVVLWKLAGIQWADAERLGRGVHGEYKVDDPWSDRIERWLTDQNPAVFSMEDVLGGVMMITPERMGRTEYNRASKILRRLGCSAQRVTVQGRECWRWVRELAQ